MATTVDVNPEELTDQGKLEEYLRANVYRSIEDMPKDVRREHKISYVMAMLPRNLNVSREWVEEFIDSRS